MERSKRKERVGHVVSNSMDKTAVVKVERVTRHPLYGKTIRASQKYKVHDPENICHIGDKVRIMETRPLSREKRWRLVEIVEQSKDR
jgi:small subunit ribosomal protein S17